MVGRVRARGLMVGVEYPRMVQYLGYKYELLYIYTKACTEYLCLWFCVYMCMCAYVCMCGGTENNSSNITHTHTQIRIRSPAQPSGIAYIYLLYDAILYILICPASPHTSLPPRPVSGACSRANWAPKFWIIQSRVINNNNIFPPPPLGGACNGGHGWVRSERDAADAVL